MSRYTGPRLKVMRALGVDLPGLSPKTIEKRPYPPGQHGQARKKPTEYALRLREKQKIRMGYGLTEAQLRRLVKEAKASKSPTGEKLVELVERRLDNVVFRAGFARTIPAARQLVRHGHVQVGGRRVDVPSYRVSRGEVVSLAERSHAHPDVVTALATAPSFETPWLAVDTKARTASVSALPDGSSVPFALNVQLVVEYYSQRL
ncbi:MAG: 30S ribosomal protein S4 [Polyangiaceae bacterium]|jgi:small subunit ribosomal protein S4